MARKKREEEKVETGGWLNTFADLMNLLLCFFVLLFSMSSINEEKWQQVAASFSQNYTVLDGGSTGIDDGMLIATGASQLTELSEYYASLKDAEDSKGPGDGDGNGEIPEVTPGIDDIEGAMDKIEQAGMEESEKMGEFMEQFLENTSISDAVEIKVTQNYVCLNMKGALLFGSASADLTPEAMDVLDQISGILKMYEGHIIEIEGHTDNIPIVHELYTSNDLLSDYRALAVFNYLVEDCNVSPNNLKHSGRGEYDPIASNDTAEGRAQNRRVEIKIYNSYSNYN